MKSSELQVGEWYQTKIPLQSFKRVNNIIPLRDKHVIEDIFFILEMSVEQGSFYTEKTYHCKVLSEKKVCWIQLYESLLRYIKPLQVSSQG